MRCALPLSLAERLGKEAIFRCQYLLGLISMNDPVVSTFYSDPDGSRRRRRRRRHTPAEVSPTTAYMSRRAQSMQNTAHAAY